MKTFKELKEEHRKEMKRQAQENPMTVYEFAEQALPLVKQLKKFDFFKNNP